MERSTPASAHRCADGEAGVADAAVLGTAGCAHQGTIVTERGRRAAARAGAPVAGLREARLVGLIDATISKHCAFVPIKTATVRRWHPTNHDAHMAHQLASCSFRHDVVAQVLARARRDDIMGCMGLDEAWSPGKNMHALSVVTVVEDKSHGLRSWSNAAAPQNTARPHHTATPLALAHPRSTTPTAPRKTNNYAIVLYSTRIHMRPVHEWRPRTGEPVRARRDEIMGLWGWMRRGAPRRICTHCRPCPSPRPCPMARWVG